LRNERPQIPREGTHGSEKALSPNLKFTLAKNKLLVLVACVVVIILLGIFVFRNLGAWLVVSEPLPQSLDVVFTFGGEDSRVVYTKGILPKYPKALWLLSYPTKTIRDSLVNIGLDPSRIEVVDTCANTRSEVGYLKNRLAFLTSSKYRTLSPKRRLDIGIVSNWYQMRRILVIINRKFPHRVYAFHYLTAQTEDPVVYRQWWKQKNIRGVVFSEWGKILLYLL
jgi:hypothetical protein